MRTFKHFFEDKQSIINTISGLDADNAEHAKILDRIYRLLNQDSILSNLDKAFAVGVSDEALPDKTKQSIIKDMTEIIGNLDSDSNTMNAFISRFEKTGSVVDINELSKPINSFQKVFGDDITINAFLSLARYGVGQKQKGPGEFGLACLSNKIKLAEGEGDLEVEGIGKVELKAVLSSAGGRIGYGGGSQKAKRAVIDKYANNIPTVVKSIGGTGGSLGISKFIQALNMDLPISDINNQKVRAAIANELLTMDLENFAPPVVNAISKSEDFNSIEDIYLTQNFLWYKNRDDFDALLLMSMPNKKTAMIRNEKELVAWRRSGHANATSISIIPTQAGSGREQWAQLTLNKGAV